MQSLLLERNSQSATIKMQRPSPTGLEKVRVDRLRDRFTLRFAAIIEHTPLLEELIADGNPPLTSDN